MGLFNKLKKRAVSKVQATNPQAGHPVPDVVPASNSLDLAAISIHPDIANLLWFLDGPRKNCSSTTTTTRLDMGSLGHFEIVEEEIEPSAISVKEIVNFNVDKAEVDRPPYYPRYLDLTPEQRGVYFSYLASPYDNSFDVGYMFLLYYGLEKHLMQGDFEAAFSVILKMRDAFSNKSFQSYSANALILTCIARKRADLLQDFIDSLDKSHEYEFSRNLFVLCKILLRMHLTPQDLIRVSKDLDEVNKNYIKKYPDIFLSQLEKELPANNVGWLFDCDAEIADAPKLGMQVFANTTLDVVVPVPQVLEVPEVRKPIVSALKSAHESTKVKISEMRKAGTLPKIEKKKKELPKIDAAEERRLENEYNNSIGDPLSHHFAIIQYADYCYKYREVDPAYLKKCIDLCKEDIDKLDEVQESHRAKELADIERDKDLMGEAHALERLKTAQLKFRASVPAFKRLAIIYDKQKDFDSAIEVCRKAIDWYAQAGLAEEVNSFVDRQNKLIAKRNKQQTD
jgi:hypothetical protein